MKKILLVILVLLVGYASHAAAGNNGMVNFTSIDGDYKTVVPAGWKVSMDREGDHYTNTTFASGTGSSFTIRWYTRYATHRQINGLLEMYGGSDDFIRQNINWYGEKNIVEATHEIELSGRKAQSFTGKINRRVSQDQLDDVIMARRVGLGGLVDASDALNGGRTILTVIPMSSGFYVLSCLLPESDFERYREAYNQMLASFTPLKDGPGGKPIPGSAASTETEDQKLQRYVSMIRSQHDQSISGTVKLRKTVIEFVSTMKQPPVIPEQAQRNFIQGNAIMKASKTNSDYNFAISKYQAALLDAPWWGDPYYNLGKTLIAAGQPDAAKDAMELYIAASPKDAADAKKVIYEIEAQQELQKQRDAEMAAKYGGNRGSGFDWEYLFRYGAIVKDMSFDASGTTRTISLKVITRKENGYLKSYFQIADITSSSDTFLQKFNLDWRGTQSFFLDDRTYPNKEYMTLSVASYGDGDANITLSPADNASASIRTTLTALLRERACQAVYAGNKQAIGTREFYVMGQGGAKGSLLFFPAEVKGLLENGSVQDLMPKLVAVVNYRGSDGSNQHYQNSDLGEVDGTHYHLEYNGVSFDVKEGRGEEH